MSLSASAENLNCEKQGGYDGSSNMCLELAIEGERLCKAGDCRAGVAFFQAAIQARTDDLRTLSAIYSQLGNAYFYLGDYAKAMQYHKHDLTLARTLGDKLGEAKSSGNLGNTLKVMGRFDEAAAFCVRHLELARELKDELSEGRALYNLGNVFHAKGKHVGRSESGGAEGGVSDEVRVCLTKAAAYYEDNLKLMRKLGDVAAQGRACGNLGNTHYLLGEFPEAIQNHTVRLTIARQFGDRAAERRAHSNLGNAHIFLGQFPSAAHHYRNTLTLAQGLGDRAVEAQACYSLGNTHTLMREHEAAVGYHLRHLTIAKEVGDVVGEGRACWSLGNAYAAMGEYQRALEYAARHLTISKELGDPMGEATAKMNVADLRKVLDLPTDDSESPSNNARTDTGQVIEGVVKATGAVNQRANRVRRESMEQLHLIKLTPDAKARPPREGAPIGVVGTGAGGDTEEEEEEGTEQSDSFFELVTRFQAERMDDQRCSLTNSIASNKENRPNHSNNHQQQRHQDGDLLLDMIAGMQGNRMDEQRAALPRLPGLQHGNSAAAAILPDESFLEQVARCQGAGGRMEDQRSPLPQQQLLGSSTVPDDDFFALIMRFQGSGRMDDQRAAVPTPPLRFANGATSLGLSRYLNGDKKKK